MTYRSEAQALDAEIVGMMKRWHQTGEPLHDRAFDDLARRVFDHQLRYNQPYRRYCERLGVTSPRWWQEIPAVPAAAFKEAALTTFNPERAELIFETSGTTRGLPGRHYMENSATYDAALLAGFDRFVLSDGARLRYFNLVPDPAERANSSLGYMMARVAELLGKDRTGWYVRGGELLIEEVITDLNAALSENHPVCIAATAFALVDLLDVMETRNCKLALPRGSRLMETGGFKGRARAVDRNELYARIRDRFAVPNDAIVSEYGMTELSSQYYAAGGGPYSAPPWLRTRVVGPERATVPNGATGALLHVDLANRSSCVAIQTEDLGIMTDDGLVLIGRDPDAAPRGCSLDAEELLRR
ncbi:MAG: hypothetical protein JO113_08260 [Candidatus Eremiobacteraeota bacterium]|nr:hypothetical protein [Candidatus Eremiobacteraeota bacterium]